MVGDLFGYYQIIGETGFGEMGAVYRAQDTRSDRVVAIKLLPAEYLNDLGLRATFERESRLVASLDHEAIVPVYEFGEHDGYPFIAMQYMPNGSLADRLVQGAIPPEETARFLERLSRAIDYIHERGLIHRDLKPSNILFDEKDLPYLADFGIARPVFQIQQPGRASGGTPAYLSPEQASGEEAIDGRSDLYSLGVVLFEMLTRRLPFEGETPLAVMLMHLHDPPPSLRAVDRSLSPALDETIQRLLAKRPEDRYATAGEFFAAFQKALEAQEGEGLPVEQVVPGSSNESTPNAQPGPDGLPREQVSTAAHSHPAGVLHPDGVQAVGHAPAETEGWQGIHFSMLFLVTVFGIMLAASLVAFIRRGPMNGSGGIRMSYDGGVVNLTNESHLPVDLSGVVFRRISADGTATASFPASRWLALSGKAQALLQPGACYQLLRTGAAPVELKPGGKLPVPAACRELKGWLAATNPDWLFWIAEGDSQSFQVIVNGLLVQTCSLAGGSCTFKLSQPK
jgi:serine/threonine protein kinase